MTKRKLMVEENVVVDGDACPIGEDCGPGTGSALAPRSTRLRKQLVDGESVVVEVDACPIGEDCGPGTGSALAPRSTQLRKQSSLSRRTARASVAAKRAVRSVGGKRVRATPDASRTASVSRRGVAG
ncbi:MAG TPA: hypothetical protein VFK02_13945 [Kofleriaceae bacterium]|nr:hypothetical protein [Kofleriaceae bacterium]